MSNPILPGTVRDRTGSQKIMRKALAEIKRRYAGLQVDALAIFDRIPVYSLNDEFGRVAFGLTPEQLQAMSAELAAAYERWIAAGRDPAYSFWYSTYVEDATQLGTAQSVANLSTIAPAYAATRTIESIIYSTPYKTRLGMAQIKSYEHWTGLAAQQKADLAQIIGRAVVDGKNPKAVRTEIMEQLEVSRSRAAQYAQTDITDTLRQARMAEADYSSVELGLKIGLLWTSALLPTTRATHAARSGKVFNSAEVKEFYSRDGNRYRCYLPDTIVRGRFVAGSKARYKGPIVTLVSAGGRHLSVTTNHPVMTQRGLVPAAEIKVGDDLVAYGHEVENASGVANLNGEQVGSRIEDVFGSLMDSGHQTFPRVSRVDFHGDAAFMDKQVHVVEANRVLSIGMNPSVAQLLDNLALVHSDAPTAAGGSQEPFFIGHDVVLHGGVSAGGIGVTLDAAEFAHPVALGITSIPCGDSKIAESSAKGVSAYSRPVANGEQGLSGDVAFVERADSLHAPLGLKLHVPEAVPVEGFHDGSIANPDTVGDVLQRLAGFASFDKVVDVVRGEFDGHVYDLQELSGLMLGSEIVASNCHCSVTETLLDSEGKPILTDKLKAAMLKEKATWQAAQVKK